MTTVTVYLCEQCGHMPAEHAPHGCMALSRAASTSPNPMVRSGYIEIGGGRCGCRHFAFGSELAPTAQPAMLNGELVREIAPRAAEMQAEEIRGSGPVSPATTATSSPSTQGGNPPMTFDIENYGPGQRMEGNFAGKEVKAQLWINKIPFEVSAPPQRQSKPPAFMVARPDGTLPAPDQWWLPIRLLQYRDDGTGTFGYKMQADGEGGQEVEEHILTFDAGAAWRDQQMQALAQYVQEAGRAGPFRLDQGDNSKRGAPWVLKNWKPEDAGYPPTRAAAAHVAATATPAPAPTVSALASPPPVPQAPAPPVPPAPPADPYTYDVRYDGVPIRWKSGMADWEEVPAEQHPAHKASPPVPIVQAQPLASTRTVVGINPGDRMEGAAQVAIEQADGTQIRQIHYQGGGVVQTPQGVLTQVASGDEPRTRQEAISGQAAQTAVTAGGALGVEEPASVAPGPSPAPTRASQQSVIRQAYDNGSPVQVDVICDHPEHTDNGGSPAHINMPAFWDPSVQQWKQTHNCPGSKKVRVLDVTSAVKTAAGVV